MSRPLFSCVVAVKGARPFFDEAIASLCSQGLSYTIVGNPSNPSNSSNPDLEIIIQDGDVEPDAGLSDAFNKGFAKAHGEWFFWLNADDVLLPGALKRIKELIRSSTSASHFDSLSWLAGNMVTIDEQDRIIRCLRDRGDKTAYEGRPIRVFGPSSFFRRELLEQSGGFDTSLKVAMDTDLWLRFREQGHWFEKVGDYLFGFRMHEGSLTMNPKNAAEAQAKQDREVARVHAAHHVSVDAVYLRRRHLRRLIDGSYPKELYDTWRFRGKKWQEVFQ